MKEYPKGTVRKLLNSTAVTAATKEALQNRLRETKDYEPKFFDGKTFKLLQTICWRLIPQDAVDCAAFIDKSLSENKGDGWRYDELPDDAETFKRGLNGINETANIKFEADFLNLKDSQQDEILTEIQNGKAAGGIWKKISSELFFEELLAKTVEVYYAYPLAQEEIGYAGMADAPGWTQIGLNERESREPQAIRET